MMTDLPPTSDEFNGWTDRIFQMLRYTIYRAISESDDAKGHAQPLVAAASSSSSSSSRSGQKDAPGASNSSRSSSAGRLSVRSHGVTNQIQQAVTIQQQIQKAIDDVLFETKLMEQAMHAQFESDPIMRPENHPYFYAWHDAVLGVRKQFVSEVQKKSTRFKTWKDLLQELEQKGWSTAQDLQCVTQIHNDVMRWVQQIKPRVVKERCAEVHSNLRFKCMLSIAKLTEHVNLVRVINISPFEEVKFEMRAILWGMVALCDPLCKDDKTKKDDDDDDDDDDDADDKVSVQEIIEWAKTPRQSN